MGSLKTCGHERVSRHNRPPPTTVLTGENPQESEANTAPYPIDRSWGRNQKEPTISGPGAAEPQPEFPGSRLG